MAATGGSPEAVSTADRVYPWARARRTPDGSGVAPIHQALKRLTVVWQIGELLDRLVNRSSWFTRGTSRSFQAGTSTEVQRLFVPPIGA